MNNKSKAAIPEPAPTGEGEIVLESAIKNILSQKFKSVWDYEVIKDLKARAEEGRGKYGTYLRVSNGRDALNDLYQKILDAIMYDEQYRLENHNRNFSFSIGGILIGFAKLVKREINAREELNNTSG
jgi:hypothetical protein